MLKELVHMIKEELAIETGRKITGLRLPTEYNYSMSGGTVYLNIKHTNKNMQGNPGAFDAWALVIKRWIPRVTKIILSWEKPALGEGITDPHYQRFLYRVIKSIRSHLLIGEIHPLIDSKMIRLINEALKLAGKDIEFDIIRYVVDGSDQLVDVFGESTCPR